MPFKRDLIIATFDPATNEKVLYQIPEDTWRSAQKVSDEMAAELDDVLNKGGVLAAVPELEQIGAACYLINLASINVNPFAPPPAEAAVAGVGTASTSSIPE